MPHLLHPHQVPRQGAAAARAGRETRTHGGPGAARVSDGLPGVGVGLVGQVCFVNRNRLCDETLPPRGLRDVRIGTQAGCPKGVPKAVWKQHVAGKFVARRCDTGVGGFPEETLRYLRTATPSESASHLSTDEEPPGPPCTGNKCAQWTACRRFAL